MNDKLKAQYEAWREPWELANPAPALPKRDSLLQFLQIGVVVGSIVLSGTRTGNVVAEIGTFADFGAKLGLAAGHGIFIAVEAVLAFITFDVGVLLAGYLTGEESDDTRWYKVLLVSSLLPALVANVVPAIGLAGKQYQETAEVFTNALIGIATPIMAFVGGRVLGVSRTRHSKSISLLVLAWETSRNNAWRYHFSRYIKPKMGEVAELAQPLSVVSDNGGLKAKIVSVLGLGPLSLQELAEATAVTRTHLIPTVSELAEKGSVSFDGDRVAVIDF